MTTCYTFKIEMTVQVLSEEGEDAARASLDQHGGFISTRFVELVETTPIRSLKAVKE